MRVKLTCNDKIDLLRQTEGSKGIWGDCQFLSNQPTEVCDGWIVFDEISQPERTVCDPSKTIFIAGEPSPIHRYNERFLSQFAAVVTPQKDVNHPCVINHHPSYPWYVGVRFQPNSLRTTRLQYNEFKAMADIPKTKELSVICSTKTMTSDHCKRLTFLEKLTDHFGKSLDIYGGGYDFIEDKWDALAPYKYSIVLENSQTDHYWTEKVSDAFLAASFPFYWGCPNLNDYFPQGSFQSIDINHPKEAIELITEALQHNRYAEAFPLIRQARELVLDRYNLFPVIIDLMKRLPSSKPCPTLIRPEEHFRTSSVRRLGRGMKRWLRDAGQRT